MASFRKLQSGEWGVGLDASESAAAVAGQALIIERKDGTKGRAVLGAIVTRGEWGSIWTIAPKVAATPPAAPKEAAVAPAVAPAAVAAPVAALPIIPIAVPTTPAPKKRARKALVTS